MDRHYPMGAHSPGTLIVVRGLWKWGINLSKGALFGDPGGGGLGALKVTKGRLWGWASLFMGAQVGNLEWTLLRGTLRYG